MLAQPVYIFNVTSLGLGKYSFELYFQNIVQGQFLNLNDTITDSISNSFKIISPTVLPHADGAVVTVEFITADVLPTEDVDYDSIAFTPGQVDVRPNVRTSGAITNPSLYSGPNYEYTITAGWDLPAEADQATVGDFITDFNGKEFELSFLDPTNRWNVPCRVIEVIREGVAPVVGDASLYSATPNYKFFQGTPISDPARTVVRNQDNFDIDYALKQLSDSIANAGSGSAIETQILNSSGGTLSALQPVGISNAGSLIPIDVSVETSSTTASGIVKASAINNALATVVLNGKIENVSLSANFGDVVYVSKSGALTSTAPDIGVNGFAAGDFVIKVGQITKNATNPSNKDLLVAWQLMGQL